MLILLELLLRWDMSSTVEMLELLLLLQKVWMHSTEAYWHIGNLHHAWRYLTELHTLSESGKSLELLGRESIDG